MNFVLPVHTLPTVNDYIMFPFRMFSTNLWLWLAVLMLILRVSGQLPKVLHRRESGVSFTRNSKIIYVFLVCLEENFPSIESASLELANSHYSHRIGLSALYEFVPKQFALRNH